MKIEISNILSKGIDTIVFDLGGVIIDVNIEESLKAFAALNITNLSYKDIVAENEPIFRELELGLITPNEFIDKFHILFPASKSIPADSIWTAWNACLQPYINSRIALIKELKPYFNIYLLSNTNLPHRIVFKRMFQEQFGYELESLFIECFYSDELHLRKPDPEIYNQVTDKINTKPEKILFIDDNATNIAQAKLCGWNIYHLTDGETITDIFNFTE